MASFANFARQVARLCYLVAGAALCGIIMLTVTDVFLRLLRHPIVGAYEMVGLLGALVIGLAIPQCTLDNGHVLMDFLTCRFPKGLQVFLEIATRLLGAALFLLIAWNLWELGEDLRLSGEVSPTLHIPQFPLAYAVAISAFIQSLVLTALALEKTRMKS
jgi:TRAP-type C4-dicarboxylate transport system permease small subunit